MISDDAGHSLVETRSEGPWFYAKLPAGSYTIAASFGGTTVRRPIKIGTRAMDRIDLRWDD